MSHPARPRTLQPVTDLSLSLQLPASRRPAASGVRGGLGRILVAGLLAPVLLGGCDSPPEAIGSWRQVGKQATLDLRPDGSFRAVDNQGMEVQGRFVLQPDGNAVFEVLRSASPPETVNALLVARGNELTVRSEDGAVLERYRRAEQQAGP